MIIVILGMAAIVVVAVLTFRTARDYGRNAALWTLAAIGCGLGFQFVVPFFIGVVLGFVLVVTGTKLDEIPQKLGDWVIAINLACLLLSFIAMWLVLRLVSRIPEDEPVAAWPPPPPTF